MTGRSITLNVKEWVFDHKGYSFLGVLFAATAIVIPIYLDATENEKTAVSELRPITQMVTNHAGAIGALLVLDTNNNKKVSLIFKKSRDLSDSVFRLEEFLSEQKSHLPREMFSIAKNFLEKGRDFSITLKPLVSVERILLGDPRGDKERQSDTTEALESLRIKAGELINSHERMEAEFDRYFGAELK